MAFTLVQGTARADNFLFSFSNDPSWGNVNGTVTGEIFGLTNNSTSAATDIQIFSYPAGLVLFGSYPTPIDVMAWTGGSVGENGFTETAGNITGGGFFISGANGVYDQLFINAGIGYPAGTNFLDIGSSDTTFVWNNNGIGATGVTFTTATAAATPELSSVVLMSTMLLGLAFVARKRIAAGLRPALRTDD
jgi:hypothetical protein